jgi:hypothetical protein
MQEWIRRQNIEKFRRLLAKATDPEQRRILLRLLKEESGASPRPTVSDIC